MDGLVYLPSRNLTFNADSKMGNDKTTLVMNRLIWNNVSMNLQPNPDRSISVAGTTPAPSPATPTPVASSGIPKLVR